MKNANTGPAAARLTALHAASADATAGLAATRARLGLGPLDLGLCLSAEAAMQLRAAELRAEAAQHAVLAEADSGASEREAEHLAEVARLEGAGS